MNGRIAILNWFRRLRPSSGVAVLKPLLNEGSGSKGGDAIPDCGVVSEEHKQHGRDTF